MMRPLRIAIGFLTRFPLAARAPFAAHEQAASVAWYPLVGVSIGAALAALAWLLQESPPLLSAALLLAAWVACTGALHLDGLADTADAWIGGIGDRARTLAIMKDPRSGPAGVVAVVLVLLLKFAALASLDAPALSALALAPLLARAGLTATVAWMPYAREQGLASPLLAAPQRACATALALSAIGALAFGRAGAYAALAAVAAWLLWRRACLLRLGGFTGDTAGALAEGIETIVLVVFALTS